MARRAGAAYNEEKWSNLNTVSIGERKCGQTARDLSRFLGK